MSAARTTRAALRGLDLVAEVVVALLGSFGRRRGVRLVERERGGFWMDGADSAADPQLWFEDDRLVGPRAADGSLTGARIEAALQPGRFVFRTLELPARATDFLDGVVRAQIDRLTPWTADQAVYGCSSPTVAGTGRVNVVVAATAKQVAMSYLNAFAALGARSVMLTTRPPEVPADTAPIPVVATNLGSSVRLPQARTLLLTTFIAACLLAAGAAIAATVIGGSLQAQQDKLAKEISARRQVLLASRNVSGGDPKVLAERQLAQRKSETPATVIVLEALSAILPDHTYLTELRVEGNKLRIMGVTQDAPSLIRLLEQSRYFHDATFFAPTTRGLSDSGDRFNIEAGIKPVFTQRP